MTYQNFLFFCQIVSFWFIQLSNDLPVCLLYILSPKPREYIQLSASPGQHLLSSLFFWMLQQGNLSSFCMLFGFCFSWKHWSACFTCSEEASPLWICHWVWRAMHVNFLHRADSLTRNVKWVVGWRFEWVQSDFSHTLQNIVLYVLSSI